MLILRYVYVKKEYSRLLAQHTCKIETLMEAVSGALPYRPPIVLTGTSSSV